MFDCVLPTRSGRHGQAWTWAGPVNLKNARFADDAEPLDGESDCPASRDYSKAYLHHLVKSGEILGQVLLSWHNVAVFETLMARMRTAIAEGRLEACRREFRAAGYPLTFPRLRRGPLPLPLGEVKRGRGCKTPLPKGEGG